MSTKAQYLTTTNPKLSKCHNCCLGIRWNVPVCNESNLSTRRSFSEALCVVLLRSASLRLSSDFIFQRRSALLIIKPYCGNILESWHTMTNSNINTEMTKRAPKAACHRSHKPWTNGATSSLSWAGMAEIKSSSNKCKRILNHWWALIWHVGVLGVQTNKGNKETA